MLKIFQGGFSGPIMRRRFMQHPNALRRFLGIHNALLYIYTGLNKCYKLNIFKKNLKISLTFQIAYGILYSIQLNNGG